MKFSLACLLSITWWQVMGVAAQPATSEGSLCLELFEGNPESLPCCHAVEERINDTRRFENLVDEVRNCRNPDCVFNALPEDIRYNLPLECGAPPPPPGCLGLCQGTQPCQSCCEAVQERSHFDEERFQQLVDEVRTCNSMECVLDTLPEDIRSNLPPQCLPSAPQAGCLGLCGGHFPCQQCCTKVERLLQWDEERFQALVDDIWQCSTNECALDALPEDVVNHLPRVCSLPPPSSVCSDSFGGLYPYQQCCEAMEAIMDWDEVHFAQFLNEVRNCTSFECVLSVLPQELHEYVPQVCAEVLPSNVVEKKK